MKMRISHCVGALALFLAMPFSATAQPLTVDEVPEPLQGWIDWALHGHEQGACPHLYGHGDDTPPICAWPSQLVLELDDAGGRFEQHWRVYAETRVALPGDSKVWPLDVRLADEALPVQDAGSPHASLASGSHVVAGRFVWSSLPELLQIPPTTGIVSLSIRGQRIESPRRDAQGRLWLQKRASREAGQESQVQVVVHRRAVDEIPLRLRSRIELRVSGVSREVLLGRALPDGFVPMSLTSPLPARIDPDGRLRVQVRPGTWVLSLDARHAGPALELQAPSQASGEDAGTWDPEEVWVFDARPHLRRVEVEEGILLDPSRTTLPPDWQQLPAYLMKPGGTLRLVEQRRGDADPAPDVLSLSRDLWLDFDGGGYTLRDEITGEIRRSSRLEVLPSTQLGRASLNEHDQVITRLEGAPAVGMEIPRGTIHVTADSRTEDTRTLSAVGWNHDFEELSSTLHLPPGWSLLHASGVDLATSTWLNRWTLLDLFFVLVIAMAVLRLSGPRWGMLALATLALSYTEPRAPQMVWVAVVVGQGLGRAVTEPGRMSSFVRAFRWASMIVLVLLAIPFGVREVRVGLYPTLAHRGTTMTFEQATRAGEAGEARATLMADSAEHAGLSASSAYSYGKRSPAVRYAPDPNAAVTTGPGLPNWNWERVELRWSGPVDRSQMLNFVFIPPWLATLLSFLRVALLSALVAHLLWSEVSAAGARLNRAGSAAATGAMVLLALALAPHTSHAEMPEAETLAALRTRLLAQPECQPHCASIPRLRLEASPGRLDLRLEVDVEATSAVPLPGGARSWVPADVQVDGTSTPALHRSQDGVLWVNLEPGRHQVVATGPLADRDEIDLPLPLRPHELETELEGWVLHGLHDDGQVESNLRLSRVKEAQGSEHRKLDPGAMSPFLRVQRTLVLGLEWQLATSVVRMTPAERAVVLEIPLLDGEAVTTDKVRVENGMALVSMAPGQSQVAWTSTLDERSRLELRAPESVPWVEVWRLDVSPIWHLDIDGIPPIHQPATTGARQREWRPWPGETVALTISRPRAASGPTLTIDASKLVLKPGLRSTDAELKLRIRSSRGAQHALTLPQGATLQSVEIDGVAIPLRQEDRRVTLPLHPGRQFVQVHWQEPRGIHGSAIYHASQVDLGTDSVNAEVEIQPSVGRWVLLTGGPRLGPAVLFWSVLCVLAIVAYGLGLVHITPLRFRHWLLLGIGLTQITVPAAAVVVAWLLTLGWRRARSSELSDQAFNLFQVMLVMLTTAALVFLFSSIEQGLLGHPRMQIGGNSSSASLLRWYQDRIPGSSPDAWLLSVPTFVYRLAMLAWALWIAQALVGWLRWGWACFTEGGIWRRPAEPSAPATKGAPK